MVIATRRASRTRRTRTAITFAAASLLSIVITPAALAAPSGDQGVAVQPGDGAAHVQVDTAGAVASEAPGASNGSDDLESEGGLEVSDHLDSIDAVVELGAAPSEPTDAADGDATDTAAGDDGSSAVLAMAACDDHLVTLTPSGASGPAAHAVAITAQAHEYGQPGWDMASWAASEGTIIRTVIAEAADGATSTPSATPTGTAYAVAALTFCGTVDSADAASGASAEAPVVAAMVEPTTTRTEDDDRPALPVDGPNSEVDGPNSEVDGPNNEVDGPNNEVDGPNSEVDGPNSEVADAPTDDDHELGVIRLDTTDIAPIVNAGSDMASGAAAGDDLATLPVAKTSPSTAVSTSAVTFGSTKIGSTTLGLLTVGLLSAALLVLAAFRRTGNTGHAHLGGQA